MAPNCEGDWVGCCGAGGAFCAQMAPCANSNRSTSNTGAAPLIASPSLLRQQRAAELRPAWILRLRRGQAREGTDPHTSKIPSRNSGSFTMKSVGFDESLAGTRCSQEQV